MTCNRRIGDLVITQAVESRQQPALKCCAGDDANRIAAQPSLPHWKRRNGSATQGRHARAMDAAGLPA